MNQIAANQIEAIITAFKRQRAIIACRVLFCVDNGRIRQRVSKLFSTVYRESNICHVHLFLDDIKTIVFIWRKNMLRYLSADIICSEKQTVFPRA